MTYGSGLLHIQTGNGLLTVCHAYGSNPLPVCMKTCYNQKQEICYDQIKRFFMSLTTVLIIKLFSVRDRKTKKVNYLTHGFENKNE